MARWSHSKPEIRRALDDAHSAGLKVEPTTAHGHSWGYIRHEAKMPRRRGFSGSSDVICIRLLRGAVESSRPDKDREGAREMEAYDFTLRLDREVTSDEADALYGALDDGSIITGPGGTTIEFTRESQSWADAIGTAIRDIENTVSSLRVIGVGQEDLVSVLEIANRVNRSREAVRLWATGQRGPGGFPEPAWESPGGERFWQWPDVARWVRDRMNLAVEVVPNEIRWADEILKARLAMAEAQQILKDADDATRRYLGPLLEQC